MNGKTTVQVDFDRKNIDYKRAKSKRPITATGPFIGASIYQLQYNKYDVGAPPQKMPAQLHTNPVKFNA